MNKFTHAFVIAQVMITMWVGCTHREPLSQPTAMKPLSLRGLPTEVAAKQRSTTVVPGSDGSLRLTIDDITRGQVMVSLVDKDGGAVLAATSLTPGDSAKFKLGQEMYQLTLKGLENALVGEDFAALVISTGLATDPLSEREKIERLLSLIEQAEGDVFIRNGTKHSAKEAADHLRSKWQAVGTAITTVDEFIDQVATKSSLSDEPYRVRQADGNEALANEYLRDKLGQIDDGL